jgi:hypothetical protein
VPDIERPEKGIFQQMNVVVPVDELILENRAKGEKNDRKDNEEREKQAHNLNLTFTLTGDQYLIMEYNGYSASFLLP